MTMFRMPIFTWNILLTSVLVLMAFPVLAAALLALEADRKFGAHIFDPQNNGALLWQHLFWFFGHPEVYIIAIPFFGIVSEILPVFSRKPIFGYKGLVFATIAIAGLSVTVWAHHMFPTGAVLLPFFSFMTFLIAVPTGVKFFNWIGTMWGGSLTFETPMLWSIGFLVTFLFGGLTGMILASPPLDWPVSDSYFVVAHLHYVAFGTVAFAMFAGFYFWWPKMTGRMLDERLDKIHLDAVRRVPHDVPHPALARRHRHAAPVRRLPGERRVHDVQHDLHDRCVPARRLDAAVHLQRHQEHEGPDGQHGRPVGLRPLARVGDVLPGTSPQLRLAAAYPVRVAGLRPALPARRRARPADGEQEPHRQGLRRTRPRGRPGGTRMSNRSRL
jgi:cytochrome c oxidase subunit I